MNLSSVTERERGDVIPSAPRGRVSAEQLESEAESAVRGRVRAEQLETEADLSLCVKRETRNIEYELRVPVSVTQS